MRRVALLFLVALGIPFGPAAAQERRLPPAGQRRVALVVGNDAYPAMRLRNGINDARAMAAALAELGFEVDEKTDVGAIVLERAVRAFVGKLAAAETGFFFYAGHGVQIEGENYLVPVDFEAQDEVEAKHKAYKAELLREEMERGGARVNVIVLDACRDNPFRFTRSGARGLSAMQTGRGTLIALATGPGQTASDNQASRNGLFTQHLLEALRVPGLRLQDVFERAKAGVGEASGQRQRPWIHSDLVGDVYLRRAATAGPPATVPSVGAPPASGLDLGDLERQAQAQKQMASDFGKAEQFEGQPGVAPQLRASAWERFLQAYGADRVLSADGERMRAEARARIERLKKEEATTPVAPATGGAGAGGTRRNDKDGLEYVFVPAGTFQMGCVPSDGECQGDEKPRHSVTLSHGFWIGKTEVTVGAFRRFASASGRSMPSAPSFNSGWRLDDRPIVNVDWNDAKAFCEWSGARLPTEAEWEYAARGGREGSKYPWGDSISHDKANYAGSGGTSAVCSFAPNGFGLCDVTGNVWEWCADWHQDNSFYAGSQGTDPKGATNGLDRVVRGGSWGVDSWNARASRRIRGAPRTRGDDIGLRCAWDVAP